MYPSTLVLISTLSIWSLGAAAAPLPYARSLSVRSPSMMAVDSDVQARMVDDILEEREGEGEGEGEGLPVETASSTDTPPKPKPHHHHYTVDSLNTYLSNYRHHHHGPNQKATVPTTPDPVTDSAQVADGRPPAGAEPPTEAALATSTNAAPATEAPPVPATDAAPPTTDAAPPTTDAAPPADTPPVMRRAFFWDDMEDLD